MYNEIIVTDTREEIIQYPNQQWKHVVLYTVLSQTRFGYIPLHWHNALQFIYVIEGVLVVGMSDVSVSVNKGEGLFINSNTVHEIKEQKEGTKFYCWNIELTDPSNFIEYSYVTQIVSNTMKLPYLKLISKVPIHNKLLELIAEAAELYKEKTVDYMLDVTINYFQILKYINRIMDNQVTTSAYYFDPRVKQLIEYIQINATTKITLNELSNIIHMSESETIKLFKRYMQQTPFQYLLNFRLEQSIDMLCSNKGYAITEIALGCGFSTTSYYIKLFKTKYGETPKKYRRRLRELKV